MKETTEIDNSQKIDWLDDLIKSKGWTDILRPWLIKEALKAATGILEDETLSDKEITVTRSRYKALKELESKPETMLQTLRRQQKSKERK